MTRSRFARLIAGLAFTLAASAIPLHDGGHAHAQPAAAIGKPLQAPQLAPGTVSVRVIAGSTSSPVTGGDVTLLVDNVPRVMRTDGGGRAIFTGLPINAKVQARIKDSEGKDIVSDGFTVPDQGGIQVMLTTKPFAGGASAAPMGMGGMTGRKASGQPQFDQELPGGTYQVRLTYDNLTMKDAKPFDAAPPAGSLVTLVGYVHDNSVTVEQKPVDTTGVTRFEGLDVSGGTVYYALATLPRGSGVDRMMAMPVPPVSQGGSKVILSAEKRESTAPPVDDLKVPAMIPTPAGKVRITLDGVAQDPSPIRLVDAVSKVELGRKVPSRPPPDASKVESASQFVASPAKPPGTLAIDIHGGPGSVDKPMPEIAIRVIPVPAGAAEHAPGTDAQGNPAPPGSVLDTAGRSAGTATTVTPPPPATTGAAAPPTPAATGSGTPAAQSNQSHAGANHAGSAAASHAGSAAAGSAGPTPVTPTVPGTGLPAPQPVPAGETLAKTDANGVVTVTVAPGTYKIIYVINGKEFETTPFDLSKSGGDLEAVARWEGEGRMEAMFDFVPRANQVVYAETTHKNVLYRSLPFLPISTSGTHVSVVVYPPALFSFSLRALMDDEQLAVRGTFSVEHRSWIPHRATEDGMIIPLPRGFKGAVVAPESQDEVTVAPGEGFRIIRPIPPGGIKFVGGFSLDAENGDVQWALDLPNGTIQSGIEIRKSGNMSVKGLPPGTQSRVAQAENGSEWLVVFPISIHRGKSMQMTIAGVPSHPSWKTWVPRIVGVAALLLICAGVAFGVSSRKRAAAVAAGDAEARKQKLLDELVELERTGADPSRREALVAELERLWK